MAKINTTEYVQKQYQKSDGLNTRISIHEKYSTNKMGLNKIAARWPAKAVAQFSIPKLKSSGNQVLIVVLLSCDTKQSNRIDIPTAYDKNNTLPLD